MGLFKKESTPSNKIGRVRKCPQCGAAVPASQTVCPECGWEIDDVNDTQSAVQRLSAELKASHNFFSVKSEKDVIGDFPIPKSKADLMELTVYFRSKLLQKAKGADANAELYSAYKTKYEECILKCKLFYENDKDFAKLIKDYDEVKKKEKLTKNSIILVIVVGVLAIIGIVIWLLVHFL